MNHIMLITSNKSVPLHVEHFLNLRHSVDIFTLSGEGVAPPQSHFNIPLGKGCPFTAIIYGTYPEIEKNM